MDRDSYIWAAGLYEGEGNLYRPGYSIRLQVGMTDEDVVRRFAKIVGAKVAGPYNYAKKKPVWRATLLGWENVRRVYEQFEPWLGERRKADFLEALSYEGEERPAKGAVSEPCDRTVANSQTGYMAHITRREAPCQPCKDARAAWYRAYRKRQPSRPMSPSR